MQQVFTGIIREDILRIDRADKRFSRATSANATAQRLIKRARSLCCLSVPENEYLVIFGFFNEVVLSQMKEMPWQEKKFGEIWPLHLRILRSVNSPACHDIAMENSLDALFASGCDVKEMDEESIDDFSQFFRSN
eukprot:TRINITY_DN934_c0_g1_i2.p1 TRINITY_DN934_c0_g1~~TRINITY_DN934_c0_g1_i2.p1  ORF type:complete len:135 (-),score=18.72 TRINITY_DN934_c0_g1_i2:60-464(-)